MALFSILVFGQDRVAKQVFLKNGYTITGYVSTQPDGSYKVETLTGDVILYSNSEIKRIVDVKKTEIVTPDEITPSGNAYYEGQTVYKKGRNLYFYENNKPLTKNDFETYQGWQRYQRAQKTMKLGTNIMIWGTIGACTGGALIGTIVMLCGGDEYNDGPILIAHGAMFAGIFVAPEILITGLIINTIGNVHLGKIEKTYNQHPGYVLEFGAQQSGIGLALKF